MQTTTQIAHTPEKTNARSHHAEFGDYNVNFYKQQCCTHINQTKPNRTEPFQIHLIWYMHDGKRDKCENETWHRFIALHLSWSIVSMVGHFLPKRWIYNIVMDTVCAMATIEHWVLSIDHSIRFNCEQWALVCRWHDLPASNPAIHHFKHAGANGGWGACVCRQCIYANDTISYQPDIIFRPFLSSMFSMTRKDCRRTQS